MCFCIIITTTGSVIVAQSFVEEITVFGGCIVPFTLLFFGVETLNLLCHSHSYAVTRNMAIQQFKTICRLLKWIPYHFYIIKLKQTKIYTHKDGDGLCCIVCTLMKKK
jgi:hypothetical protein